MNAPRAFPVSATVAALALFAFSPWQFAQTAEDPGMGVRVAIDTTVAPPEWRFSWWGRSGRHYLVQRSDDLFAPWTTLPGLNPRGEDAVLTYVEVQAEFDPNDPDAEPPRAFFRVIEFNPGSPPLVGNALPDVWEEFYFGKAEIDPAADADGDGLSNLQEYQQGTGPTDFYNGIAPVLTSLLGPGGALGPDDTLRVLVSNAAGQPLANAPLTFMAQTGGHQLAATRGGVAAGGTQVRADGSGIARAFLRGGAPACVTRALATTAGATAQLDLSHPGQDVVTDADRDGLTNAREIEFGTDRDNPDTDGDGTSDGVEVNYGTNPTVASAPPDIAYVAWTLPLPPGHVGGEASAISNAGHAVGYVYGGTNSIAVRWDWKTGAIETAPTNVSSYPERVNDLGTVVGEIDRGALYWPNGQTAVEIGRNSTHTLYSWGVNSTNTVVGHENAQQPGDTGAFVWQAGNFSHLAAPAGYRWPEARGINDRGQVTGRVSAIASGAFAGVLWDGGAATVPMDGPVQAFDNVHDIDPAGRILGRRSSDAGVWSAADGYRALPRGSLSGTQYVWRLTRYGEVVGQIGVHPVLWQPNATGAWEVREISPRILLAEVADSFSIYSMNDHGQIVGGYESWDDGESRPVVLLPVHRPRMIADLNRDGLLGSDGTDDATVANPFRFWINDDDDDGDDKRSGADDVPLPEGSPNRDSADGQADGLRDMEDFFPVFLDIRALTSALPPGVNDVSYWLRHDDEAVGVVFTNFTRAQALNFLRGATTELGTGFGPLLAQPASSATVTKVTAAGIDISTTGIMTASPAFFDRIANHDGGVLLVEASKATTKPLLLEVRRGNTVVAELELVLKIDPVETMFSYVNLRSFANGTPVASENEGPGFGSAAPTAAPNDLFSAIVDRKNLVFVHGYNVNATAARGSASTVFKRFYWSGSKAKFYALLWRGDDGQGEGVAPAGATPDYHRNVGQAWQQGVRFRDFLETLAGDTAIMAHSLGNLVAKVALTRARDAGNSARLVLASKPATVKHYFAVDAAVPLEATSASEITAESNARMRHSSWAEYDAEIRLWPTHWHELFAGTGDARADFTWQNVFANLEVGTNFYSSGEEVLANPLDDSTPLWEPLFFGGQRAWVAQEKMKGGNGLAAPFFRSWTGGWTENQTWYVPIVPNPPIGSPQTRRRFASEAQNVAAPGGVPTSALAAEPFFQRFIASESSGFYPGYQGSRLHAPVGDANADDEARKLVTFAKCLGEAIPALSYAQGSNPGALFRRSGMGGNLDLNETFDPATGSGFKNGWPASRGTDPEDMAWKHSDCLNVSYIHHFRFYDRMKTDGGLQ